MKTTSSNFLQVPNNFFLNLGSKKMDPIEMLIYLYLASFCFGEKKSCFPTQQRIAEDLSIAVSTVKDKIRYMTQRRIIKLTGTSRGGRARWNTYELATWEELDNLPDWYNIREQERQLRKCSSNEQPPIGPVNDDLANQPLQQPPIGSSNSRQSAINNTNRIIQSNNKNLAAGAAEILREYDESDSSEETNLPETKFTNSSEETNLPETKFTNSTNEIILPETDKTYKFDKKLDRLAKSSECNNKDEYDESLLPDINEDDEVKRENDEYERVHRYNNKSKPHDISNMYFPTATLKEIKNKIYFYFKENGFKIYGHQHKLFDLNDSFLQQLIKGYSFLPYWKDYQFGDNSLSMYVLNLDKFIEQVESQRFYEETQWEHDNQEVLIDDYIKKNDVFDIRIKDNRAILADLFNKTGQKVLLIDNQYNWIMCKSSQIVYAGGHLVANGYHILHRDVNEISNHVFKNLFDEHLLKYAS